MAIIVIDPRTSNPASVALHGDLAMFVDRHTCAGDSSRRSAARLPAADAWLHQPLLHGEASTVHSVAS